MPAMEIRDVLSWNLKHYRRLAGLSQEELAHRADIDRTYISSIERCLYGVSIDILDRFAKALDVTAADLLREPPADPASDPG